MEVKDFSTETLEDIVANFETIKNELKKRKANKNNFSFNVGDVIFCKNNNNEYFVLQIKEVDINNNNVVVDEFILRNNGTFDMFEDEWYYYDETNWKEYTKMRNNKIFNSLKEVIYEYNKKFDLLEETHYKELKKLIIEKQ